MERLTQIETLASKLFLGSWANLHRVDAFQRPDLVFPGVYLLAFTAADLEGARVDVCDVFYVGMSNSAGGVRQRLKQFKTGIEVNNLHSGAMRFYRDYCGGRPFSAAKTGRRLYFAALTIQCQSNKSAAKPDDMRQMGHVGCLEYYAIAHVAEQTGRNPRLNKLTGKPQSAEDQLD
jgi:hypothetical protein